MWFKLTEAELIIFGHSNIFLRFFLHNHLEKKIQDLLIFYRLKICFIVLVIELILAKAY